MNAKALVLFCGAGGSTEGLRHRFDTVGIELDENAVATSRAAGHETVHADIREQDPADFGRIDLLQASPPCQGLSMAGKGTGRQDLGHLLDALEVLRTTEFRKARETCSEQKFMLEAILCSDERSPLTFEVMRWIIELKHGPQYVMLEQVPAALPIWEAIGEVLTEWGYGVWTGNVQAEQFGVPQTRKRAILLASLGEAVSAPVPTHSKYHSRTPDRLDEGVLPWVSMAEALGWGLTQRPSYTVTGGGAATGGAEVFASGARKGSRPGQRARGDYLCPTNPRPNAAFRRSDQPAPTMAFGHEIPRWMSREEVAAYKESVRKEVGPRVNNQSGTEFDLAWPAERPAPTIAGREIVTMPGANANRFNGSTKSRNDGIRVEPWEAAVLQSFPPDYPFRGTKTKKFQQIGNAVPPQLQKALTDHLLGEDV